MRCTPILLSRAELSCVCQLWHSEGWPVLDPRVGKYSNPVSIPLLATICAKSALSSDDNLGFSRKIVQPFLIFEHNSGSYRTAVGQPVVFPFYCWNKWPLNIDHRSLLIALLCLLNKHPSCFWIFSPDLLIPLPNNRLPVAKSVYNIKHSSTAYCSSVVTCSIVFEQWAVLVLFRPRKAFFTKMNQSNCRMNLLIWHLIN